MSEIAEAAFAYQTAAGEGRQEDRRRQLPHLDRRGAAGDPARLPRGRARAERACSASGAGSRDERGRRRRDRADGRGRAHRAATWCPPMLDAARAEATLGEICDALRAEWGDYREPPRF